MKSKIDFSDQPANIVYVRPIAVDELPDELRQQAMGAETVYSVHRANGAPVALVGNRRQAFALARDNDFQPVNAH